MACVASLTILVKHSSTSVNGEQLVSSLSGPLMNSCRDPMPVNASLSAPACVGAKKKPPSQAGEERPSEIIDKRRSWRIYWLVAEAAGALTHFQVAPVQVWSYKAIKAFRLPQNDLRELPSVQYRKKQNCILFVSLYLHFCMSSF